MAARHSDTLTETSGERVAIAAGYGRPRTRESSSCCTAFTIAPEKNCGLPTARSGTPGISPSTTRVGPCAISSPIPRDGWRDAACCSRRSRWVSLANYPVVAPPPSSTDLEKKPVDAHLRSTRAIASYSVAAKDGVIGQVADFMVDGSTWMIRETVVDCGHWDAGNKIMIPTSKVSRVTYDDGAISVDSTKNALKEASVLAGS